MKEEQVEKIFNLIEPYLPKQTVVDFREFMDNFKELKQLSEYSELVSERQRSTIIQLSQTVRTHGETIKQYEKEHANLTEEVEEWKVELYKERQKQHKALEEIQSLQKKVDELDVLLKSEMDKNYQFAESVTKLAENKREMLMLNKRLVVENDKLIAETAKWKQQYDELDSEKEELEEQYTELLTEYETVQEKIQMEYGRGFQTAYFHHIRRKR